MVVGLLVAGFAPAATAASGRAATSRPVSTGPKWLSASQALARARAIGKPVVASALTTPTSETTARPGGEFTLTQTLMPVRAYQDGAWRALNPELHRNADRTVSPAVTTGGLVLSGGGTAPLAVMTSHGRSMTLWWPRALPAPTLSGATATYADVLPGVDLEVTVSPQGGFSDVLVIKDSAAAANPALESLQLRASAPNLGITATDGGLRVAASNTAQPVFSALAPQMWDSAPPPTGTRIVAGQGGTPLASPSGLPAYSSAATPGAGAHVSRVPLTVSGGMIDLAPSRAALTARGLVFPLYIDPSFESDPVGGKADNWTQVDSGFPTTSYWDESSDLQLGYCDFSGCDGLGVARDFIKMPISTELTTKTHIDSAYMYMTDVWSASCTKEAVQLWTTGTISSSTTWNKQPSFLSDLQSQSFAHGYDSSCPASAKNVTWTITSIVQSDSGKYNNETFGLKAGSESNDLYWKQFDSGASNITMTTNFHNPPDQPTSLANEPAGSCKDTYASEPTIGADDVTLEATVEDVDNAEGDDSLSTTFTIKSYTTNDVVDTITVKSGNSDTGVNLSEDIPRATVEGWQANGATTEYSYYWYASTSDAGSPVLTSTQSETCYFLYNPLGPAPPGLSVSAASANLGSTFSATFSPPSGCSASTTPCPTSFTYQMGAGSPVTVSPNSNPASGDWTGNITMSQVGPVNLTVYGTAAGGNPGTTNSTELTGDAPSTPYPDGYFTGGSYPSLLTPGTGKDPSVWLSAGTGNGALAPPVDIGGLGTLINPGDDGPADWAGGQILHGDFSGNDVEDVMAYYPSGTHAGVGVVIGGPGDAAPLVPYSGNNWNFQDGALVDPTYANSDNPFLLVGAGDASEQATGLDDLIGILGDTSSSDGGTGYELDLYSATTIGQYGWDQVLSTTAPDGTADWNNYALATAQPGGNASAVVLFALDKVTGALYESVNPTCDTTVTTGCGAGLSGTLIGTPGSTWTTLSVPWGSSAPDLVSADVNNAGQLELWTLSGTTAVPYTLSGTTVSAEGSGAAVSDTSDDWPLSDGSAYTQGSTATTAADTITGNAAAMTGGYTWIDDDYFGGAVALDGTSAYITPPSGTIPSGDNTVSISVWFKSSIPLNSDAVLVSVQADALTSGSTTPGGYDPVMYIGTDGKLHAEFWDGSASSAVSPDVVNDGLWHHAVLTADSTSETLTVDNQAPQTIDGTVNMTGLPNLDFGAGYIGGGWLDETHYKEDGNQGYLTYFNGDVADITITDN
jgi:hypothetical protein